MGASMQSFGLTPEERMRQYGMVNNGPAAMRSSGPAPISTGKGEDVPQSQSLLERLGGGIADYLGDEENRARLALGFNAMRYKPDDSFAKSQMLRIENSRKDKQNNKTIEWAKKNNPELAKLIEAFPDKAAEIVMLAQKNAATLAKDNTPSSVREYEYAKASGYTGTFEDWQAANTAKTTVNLADDGTGAFYKEMGKGRADLYNALAGGVEQSVELGKNVDLLSMLSDGVDAGFGGAVPSVLRKWLPEGIDPSVDAYKAQLVGVAQSLRQKGTGAQSDKDVDMLLARAGSLSATPQGRAIAHQILREKADLDYERGMIARQIQRNYDNPEKLAELESQLDELNSRRIISDDMQELLDGIGASEKKPGLQPGEVPYSQWTDEMKAGKTAEERADALLREKGLR